MDQKYNNQRQSTPHHNYQRKRSKVYKKWSGPLSNGYKSSNNKDYLDMNNLNTAPSPHVWRSKKVMQQLRENKKDKLHQITALDTEETALPPGLPVRNS